MDFSGYFDIHAIVKEDTGLYEKASHHFCEMNKTHSHAYRI
jgi:hypothetical protein